VNKLKYPEEKIRLLEQENQKLRNDYNFLKTELEIRQEEMQALLNGAKLLLTSDSFLKTSQAIFNYCRELTGAKAGYIALLNKDKMENEVLFLEPGGLFCNLPLDLPMPIRGFRSVAYKTGRTVYDNNYSKSAHKKYMPKGHLPLHNVMFAPIKINNEVIGLMGLGEKPGDFNENDKRIVSRLTELVSIALINSRTLEALKDSRQKLNKLNETKDKFFSIIAHDLKNPFAALINTSELLIRLLKREDTDNTKLLAYAQNLFESSTHGLKLLDNLLEWSSSQFGSLEFYPRPINLYDTAKESLVPLENLAKHKKIKVHLNIQKDLSLQADPHMISTVFRNLISNAIKFTNQGGKVEISSAIKDHQVEICVRDNGVGMPQYMIKKLFRIDKKYSTIGTAKERGTGLGLILCKEFIEKHGGNIRVASQKGKGSEFCFTLKK
jgi:signal transduction histidine kinase